MNTLRTATPLHAANRGLMIAAAALLAFQPTLWLVETWRDPAYASEGWIAAPIVVALAGASLSTPRIADGPDCRRLAFGLLGLSALIRLLGQVFAINTVGALCLVVDVFALAMLLDLDRRRFAVAPIWLAAAFAFALPLERVVQRAVGFPLQLLSADGACAVLSFGYADLVCAGARLVVDGVDVLVDLPCSGARTALIGLFGFTLAAALRRPGIGWALIGLGVTLAAAFGANVLRIAVLAIGIAEPARVGVDVMAQPWHDLIGLAALSLVGGALLVWARLARPAEPARPIANHPTPAPRLRHPHGGLAFGVVALAVAAVIVSLPRKPIDVARAAAPLTAPAALLGAIADETALTPRERAYFERFGGAAMKAQYGAHGLLMVRTRSPLRHLHAPDECLRGLGFDVAYLGAVFAPVPTAYYRAVSPDGQVYRVAVSFVSDQGDVVPNVSTAAWRWLQGDARVWTAIQRITPDGAPHAAFDAAVWAALDHPIANGESL